jgi:hypothetical protein
MNAAERLWQALAAHDWARARSQFGPNAVVDWPHADTRMDAGAYVAAMQALLATGPATVRRTAGEGRILAVEATIGPARCGGFYDLHDGLIHEATEYWVRGTPPAAGGG